MTQKPKLLKRFKLPGVATKSILLARRETFPERDWLIVILVFGLVLISGSAWLALRYLTYQDLDQLIGIETKTVPRYHESDVLYVLETFGKRTGSYQSLVANPTNPVSDPSTASSTVSTTTTTTMTESAIEEFLPEETILPPDSPIEIAQ